LVPAPRRAHLHLLVTDGGFRPDGTFVRPPRHDVATLTEAARRTVFRMFVKRELIDGDTAQSMLAWPHAGFHVHDGVRAAADDIAFTVRLARYGARNPLALGRLAYNEEARTVAYHSDKPTGPAAGSETTDALEFLARVTSHIPDKGEAPYSDRLEGNSYSEQGKGGPNGPPFRCRSVGGGRCRLPSFLLYCTARV
jgi:hypothetical protein